MKHVFGPVPSRRLGQSLGIDTIPLKTCNWNCVYCQLGRTAPLTNERREYYRRQEILSQVEESLAQHEPDAIDWVTFVGSGEPTLHSSLGWLISQVKEMTDHPVAVISNGSLLYRSDVRNELAAADLIMPSLDAGTAELYRQINRPHPKVDFDRLVQGLIAFRRVYDGRLWVEVMLIRGLNDGEESLQAIAAIIQRIRPDEVHLNLPIRPPAETWVRPPDEEGLIRATSILGEMAKVVYPSQGDFDLDSEPAVEAILGIITRHPMRHEELEQEMATLWTPEQVSKVLADLVASGQAQLVERHGSRFWCAGSGRYPNGATSLASAPGRRDRRRQRTGSETASEISA
jgi:wyosine [tRNA(Phe)-imidazoG37] synthetase (radical SAM superfamily)